ncbi:MAG: nicotinate (nicotinamide) nucleotide adenylyltransferase, partial [Acidobacteria bacterium]|nr:nicotinate (nicotinamide) nucleotide adenylyltransferase [Acidobacteriota bacterium]
MSGAVRMGILGGTLDPIHLGHIEAALAARAALALDQVVILPSRVPPHRSTRPHASGYHRFAMASLAVNGIDGLVTSDLELCASAPSYTADTLERLHRTGLSALQIFFITGADAFAEIETWSRYPHVLSLAHFVVVSRPGVAAAEMRTRLPGLTARMVSAARSDEGSGDPAIFLLDARTPDISSTEIRRRIATGEPLTDLVAPAVESHILRHGLYSLQPVIPS